MSGSNSNGKNGLRVKLSTLVIGVIIGSVPTAAFGVYWNYFVEIPKLVKQDEAQTTAITSLRDDLTRQEERFRNMVTRFDKLDADEKIEAAHTGELTTEDKVTAALLSELTNHVHASDGRMDGHDIRMQQQQIEMTRLRSDLDGLASASGRRR